MIDQWSDDRTGWARFSDDMTMRYRLARSLDGDPITVDRDGCVEWDHVGPPKGVGFRIVFLMLNPSTADAFQLDPTINECRKRARTLGFRILEVVNLFALRSPHPADLRKRAHGFRGDDAINNAEILTACRSSHRVIAAWGNGGELDHRATIVRRLLGEHPVLIALHHLGLTGDGFPKHPLARGRHRIPADQQPVPWSAS